MEITYGFLSILAISLVSLAGAFSLSLKEDKLKKIIFYLVSISVGALLGDAFIHLIPEVFEEGIGGLTFSISIFSGFIFFFILEKFLRWHHSHGQDEESLDSLQSHDHSEKPLGALVIISDGAHNIIDGILVGVSYLAGVEIGIATTIAVLLHEIPQEIGDFGLLLHAGFTVKKALLWNFLSAIFAFIGLFLAFLIGEKIEGIVPIAISIASGGFLYIGSADLIPELHKETNVKKSLKQFIAIIIGFLIMLGMLFLE